MVAASPTRTDPTGAPRPLERHIEMVSKSLTIRAASIPLATTALNILAPSRWVRQSFELATSQIASRVLWS